MLVPTQNTHHICCLSVGPTVWRTRLSPTQPRSETFCPEVKHAIISQTTRTAWMHVILSAAGTKMWSQKASEQRAPTCLGHHSWLCLSLKSGKKMHFGALWGFKMSVMSLYIPGGPTRPCLLLPPFSNQERMEP